MIWEYQHLMKPMVKPIWGKSPRICSENFFITTNHCVSFVVYLLNKIDTKLVFYRTSEAFEKWFAGWCWCDGRWGEDCEDWADLSVTSPASPDTQQVGPTHTATLTHFDENNIQWFLSKSSLFLSWLFAFSRCRTVWSLYNNQCQIVIVRKSWRKNVFWKIAKKFI